MVEGPAGPGISDAVYILNFLFTGGRTPGCMKAADVADDAGDRGTVALLEALIQQFEKRRWMFQAYLGSNPAG